MYMSHPTTEQLKGNTPALILAALAEGPLHGYAIARRLEGRTEGYFRLNEGSLYPALHALEKQGAVSSSWQLVRGRQRRCYRITRKGRAVLAGLTREWREFLAQVNRVLGVAPDG
jgi:PadR family transcriptional regulator